MNARSTGLGFDFHQPICSFLISYSVPSWSTILSITAQEVFTYYRLCSGENLLDSSKWFHAGGFVCSIVTYRAVSNGYILPRLSLALPSSTWCHDFLLSEMNLICELMLVTLSETWVKRNIVFMTEHEQWLGRAQQNKQKVSLTFSMTHTCTYYWSRVIKQVKDTSPV